MALSVQMYKFHNNMTNEDLVMARLVNQQMLDFNALCEYLADGSTVTAADVAAVMKQIEMRLPLLLCLNAKVVCSPEGLTFRPKVSGAITQSELKAKLEAKKLADPSLDIDVERALELSDLSTGDLTATIAIDLPKKWEERFKSKVVFKRVVKGVVAVEGTTTEGGSSTGGSNESGGDNDDNGGTTTGGGTTGGGVEEG
jgi:uncharacterized membrane protein YgcG